MKRMPPNVVNFFAVQVLYPLTEKRLLGGPFVWLDELGMCAMSAAFLIGVLLGTGRKDAFEELLRMSIGGLPDSCESRRLIEASLQRDRVDGRRSIYAGMHRSFGPGAVPETPTSICSYVRVTSQGDFRIMARHGRLKWTPPGYVVPGPPTALEQPVGGVRVAYDEFLVMGIGMIVAEAMVFGHSEPDLSRRMARFDIGGQAAGVRKAVDSEVEWFRDLRSRAPQEVIWGLGSTLFAGEYEAWTQRAVGEKVINLYWPHLLSWREK